MKKKSCECEEWVICPECDEAMYYLRGCVRNYQRWKRRPDFQWCQGVGALKREIDTAAMNRWGNDGTPPDPYYWPTAGWDGSW
jgi:hypothetical protein